MQLVIGGFGFVGANTVRALLDLGADCVLTQHEQGHVPAFLEGGGGRRVLVEPASSLDIETLRSIGRKYQIDGIVHLATGGVPAGRASALELAEDIHATVTSIANVIQVASEWDVGRVLLTSAPVVYNGLGDPPWREDQPLPLTATFPMEAAKKTGEILASYLGSAVHVPCVEIRLAGMYGPNYDPTRHSVVGRLVHAAVKGEKLAVDDVRFGSAYAADASDQCYIKDAARGIALLQMAEKLNYTLYNVSSGSPTTNQQVVEAIKKVIPSFDAQLPAGHMPGNPAPSWYFDISRLQQDTGYEPQFSIESGIADYIAWLQAGNAR